MKLNKSMRSRLSVAGMVVSGLLCGSLNVAAENNAERVQGLWEYTGLTTSSGVDLPLTGVFLLSDGKFIQQAVFNGKPYSEQGSMAHSGTFSATEKGIDLKAGQTLSLNPAGSPSLEDMGPTKHALTVSHDDEDLTLVFGSGTKQTFSLLEPAEKVDIYSLSDGMLAFVDGYFVLVRGDAESAVTGYGTYKQDGTRLELKVIRWSESANGLAQNLKDVTLSARFDGQTLSLADGRSFTVTP